MDAKLKAKWVKALRSGRYKQQNDGQLRTDKYKGKPEYCCLGVLCQISRTPYRGSGGYPNEKDGMCIAFKGLSRGTQIKLATMNDATVYKAGDPYAPKNDFKKIADWIEKHVKVSRG